MELWRYYRIIRRRRWLILLCVALCVGMVFVVGRYFTEQKYTGRTTVMERQPGPEQGVPVFQDRYGQMMNLEIHLADLGHICASQTVMERTANTLQILGISLEPRRLLKSVRVEPVPQTQILQIDVTSTDPEEAKAAADVIAAEFKRFYNDIVHGATTQSREFIEKQLKDAKVKLTDAQRRMTKFKQENEVIQLSQQSTILLQRIAEIKSRATDAKVSADDASARIAMIGSQKDTQEEMKLAHETMTQNPLWQSLLNDRSRLEAELAAKSVIKGPKHPEIVALTKQLEEIKAQLATTKSEIISSHGRSLNPVKTNAVDRYLSAEAEKAASEARYAALEQAINELQPELDKLPEKEMQLAELELDVKAAQDTYALLRARLEEAKIKERESINASAIKVIEPAFVFPVDPKTPLKLALALLLSPLLGIGLAFFLNYLDNTIRTPAEAEDLLGLPVFTVIPLGRHHSLARRPDSPALSAAYQMLSSQLWQSIKDTGISTIVVASAEPDAGRSTTAANLAITLAGDGARVILVDADMRKPNLHLMFGVENKRGLSNLLGGTAAIEDTAVPTKFDGLLLIPAGPTPDNPVRLLRQTQMESFVEQISALADFVIFDTPAGITFADASIIAAHARNVVLVHSAGRVPRGAEVEFRSRLEQANANMIGVVLNRVRPEDSHGYFHYKKSYQDLLPPPRRLKSADQVKAIQGSASDEDA